MQIVIFLVVSAPYQVYPRKLKKNEGLDDVFPFQAWVIFRVPAVSFPGCQISNRFQNP